jgi:hypothetical protein
MKLRLRTPLALLLICTTPLLSQQSDPWKEYVYADDGFAISAPVELHVNLENKTHVYAGKGGNNERLAVAVLNVVGKSDPEVRDLMKQYLSSDPSVVQSSIEEISYANSPGLRARKQVGEKRYSLRSFCAGGRAFILEVSDGPEGERFMNSFRLVEAQWKEYSYPEDGIRFSSPAKPQLEESSSARKYTIDLPGGGFLITRMTAKATSDADIARRVLLRLRDDMVQNMKGKLSADSVPAGDVPAIAFDFEIPGDTRRIRGRMYYAGATIYILLAKGNPDPARFFDSFHITSP